MTISTAEFLDTLNKSNVIDPERLNRWMAGTKLNDGVSIANQLVRERMLTEWQAKYLLTGRHHLFLGPYQLLERTQRDELGDRFLGMHGQLARKVDIQVLPANLTQDPIRRASFIKRVRQTSVLDHPQLAHVYDIDEQGGRYFVVQEHIDGQQLGEVLPSNLTESKIVDWLIETLAGLKFAHASNISHGELEFEDLVVDEERKIKVQNLATCQLRPNATNKFQPADDFRAVSRLFIQLIDRLPKDSNSPTRTGLRSLISRLAFIESQSKDFEIQIQTWRTESDQRSDAQAPATRIALPAFEDTVTPSASLAATSGTAFTTNSNRNTKSLDANASFKNDSESDPDPDRNELGAFSRMAVDNPIGLLSSSFVASMILAAAATYVFLLLNPGSKKPEKIQTAQQSEIERKDRKEVTASSNNLSKEKNAAKEPKPKNPALENPALENPAQETLASIAATKLAELDKPEVSDIVSPVVPASIPSVAPSTTTQTPPPSKAAVSPPPAEPVITPEPPKTEIAKQDTAPAAPPQVDERTEAPFSKLPTSVGLPSEDITTEIKFGEVFINDRFMLGAEILSPPGISPQKVLFQMERDESDKQRWIINLLKNPKDKKSPVAIFKKTGNELLFHWLPETRTSRQAGYLRNCLIKLFTPEHSTYLRLRLPVELEPLTLKDDQLTASRVFEISNLPNPENILIEVLPVTIPETSISPNVIEFQKKLFGRILLKKEDKAPLVWVNLSAEIKQKVTLRADLTVSNGQIFKPLKNLKELQSLADYWKQSEANLLAQKAAEEAKRAPSGGAEEKQKRIDELDRLANQAKDFGVKLQDYSNIAPKMLNQEYGVRILVRFEGHEVDLAKTKLSPPPAPSNPNAEKK